MRSQIILFFLLISFVAFPQTDSNGGNKTYIFTPEILLGKTFESNEGFPDTQLQTQFILNIGTNHTFNTQQWAQRLKAPQTGLSFGVTDFGNLDSLG